VVASQPGNGQYLPTPQVARGFAVVKATQQITFAQPGSASLAQSPVTVTAMAPSGLTVSFVSLTPRVCRSGGQHGAAITLLAIGTCTVLASQPGDAGYWPAWPAVRSFKVIRGVPVTNPGSQTSTAGTAVSLQIVASHSSSGQTLTYSATGLPAGLSIGSSTGLISGTPTTTGTYTVTVTATDSTGASGSAPFTWTVTPAAAVTLVVAGPASVTAGQAASVTVTAVDQFGNTATGYTGTVDFTSSLFKGLTLPADYTFTAADGGIRTFTVTFETSGSQELTATDTQNSGITGSITGLR
jgi:hypothetical protein